MASILCNKINRIYFFWGKVIEYSRITHFDEFFAGVLIAQHYDKISLHPIIINVMTIAAVLNVSISWEDDFSYNSYTMQLFCSAFLVYVAALQRGKLRAPIIGNALHFIGVRSYTIYLMHIFVDFMLTSPIGSLYQELAVKNAHIQMMINKNSATLDQFRHLIALILTIILADLFYRFIERPFIEKNKNRYAAR